MTPAPLGLTQLPPDVLRYLGGEYLDVDTLTSLCQTNVLFRNLCKNDRLWWNLVERYLTVNPERLAAMKRGGARRGVGGTDPREELQDFVGKGRVDLDRSPISRFMDLFERAARYGYEVYLQKALQSYPEYVNEELIEEAIEAAAGNNNNDIYYWLIRLYPRQPIGLGLNEAAYNGNLELVRHIVEKDHSQEYDPDTDEPIDEVPQDTLVYALTQAFLLPNNMPVIEYLVSKVGPLNTLFEKRVLLRNAAMTSLDYIIYLERNGIVATDDTIVSALFNKDPVEGEKIIRYLIENRGIPPDEIYEISPQLVHLIPYLQEHGADIKFNTVFGEMANSGEPEDIRALMTYYAPSKENYVSAIDYTYSDSMRRFLLENYPDNLNELRDRSLMKRTVILEMLFDVAAQRGQVINITNVPVGPYAITDANLAYINEKRRQAGLQPLSRTEVKVTPRAVKVKKSSPTRTPQPVQATGLDPAKCQAIAKSTGKQCSRPPQAGRSYCYQH